MRVIPAAATDEGRVLEHIPPAGAGRRLVDDIRERSGLEWPRAAAALVSLSCDGRVRINTDALGTWARRLPVPEVPR